MRPRTLALSCALVFAVSIASPARAQNAQPAQPAAPPAQPSAASQSAPDSSSANSSAAPSAKAPSKKVWTNDDMTDLRDRSSISTVGNSQPASSKARAKSSAASRGRSAQSYRDQITRLQAQLPPLDKKISALQDAISGKQVNEVRNYSWSKPDDWKDELARLQKQRDDIVARIASLEDQARHAGAAPSQIP
jgi:uncharacterized protein YukE